MKFSNGEVFLFLHLVEVGGHPDTAPHPPPAVPVPPASICMYQTVWHLIWMN